MNGVSLHAVSARPEDAAHHGFARVTGASGCMKYTFLPDTGNARSCRESNRRLLTWGTAARLSLRGGSRPSMPHGAAIPVLPERP